MCWAKVRSRYCNRFLEPFMKTLDLTKAGDAVELMSSSKSNAEWDTNFDKIIAANDGFIPEWWFETMIFTGRAASIQDNFSRRLA